MIWYLIMWKRRLCMAEMPLRCVVTHWEKIKERKVKAVGFEFLSGYHFQ